MFIDTMKEKKKKKDRLIINISPHWLSDSKVKRCGGQRRRLLVVFGHGEDKVLPAGAEGAAGRQAARSDRHQAECYFSQEPEAPPTPSALLTLLSAPLLLLIFPGILPGTRPSDVLPLVQVDLLHLLQRKWKKKQILTFLSFLFLIFPAAMCSLAPPCELMFGSLLSFFDMMRWEKASC